MMEPSLILQLLGFGLMAASVYGGIRSDIKAIHEKLNDVKEASDEAHKRIDNILEKSLGK